MRLPMPPAVQARIRSDRAAWADRAAGTRVAEGVAVDAVAADPSILDTDAETVYGDGVECHAEIVDGLSEGRITALHNVTPLTESVAECRTEVLPPGPSVHLSGQITGEGGASTRPALCDEREADRLAFLRRVQYVDPRERHA